MDEDGLVGDIVPQGSFSEPPSAVCDHLCDVSRGTASGDEIRP